MVTHGSILSYDFMYTLILLSEFWEIPFMTQDFKINHSKFLFHPFIFSIFHLTNMCTNLVYTFNIFKN